MKDKSSTKFKIKNEELVAEISGEVRSFPKYTTQIMNLANQNSQGTRPKVVGQMSDLIHECPYRDYKGWKDWYLNKKPDSLDKATDKIFGMVENLKEAIPKIDRQMVKEWVEDLVVDKTYIGLRFQDAILKRVADMKGKKYRLSTPKEESKGIDGWIGDMAVSIKPITYKTKNMLREKIEVKFIFYDKKKDGITVDISDLE